MKGGPSRGQRLHSGRYEQMAECGLMQGAQRNSCARTPVEGGCGGQLPKAQTWSPIPCERTIIPMPAELPEGELCLLCAPSPASSVGIHDPGGPLPRQPIPSSNSASQHQTTVGQPLYSASKLCLRVTGRRLWAST